MTMMQKSVTKCRESQKVRLNLKMRPSLDKKSLIFIEQNRIFVEQQAKCKGFLEAKFTLGNPSPHSIVA